MRKTGRTGQAKRNQAKKSKEKRTKNRGRGEESSFGQSTHLRHRFCHQALAPSKLRFFF